MLTENIMNDVTIENISKYLKYNLKLEVLETVDSTNTYLKSLAEQGETEGKVVVALSQTGGKGRLGRSFYSPKKSGVYFSVLLKPEISAENSVFITTAAAVAVAETIDKMSNNTSKIKWVNDVFVNGKKVCGILTESAFCVETNKLKYAVLGIGLNVVESDEEFPEDIRNIAGCVFKKEENCPELKAKLIAEILNKFFGYYKKLEDKSFLNCYKQKSMVVGKDVLVLRNNQKQKARALEITNESGLLVEYENGTQEVLTSGEVSIREIKNED